MLICFLCREESRGERVESLNTHDNPVRFPEVYMRLNVSANGICRDTSDMLRALRSLAQRLVQNLFSQVPSLYTGRWSSNIVLDMPREC